MSVTDEDVSRAKALAGLPPNIRDSVARASTVVEFERGAHLVHAGDPGVGFFAILSGKVGVAAPQSGSGARGEVVRLGPGELVGEVAVLDGAARSADVWAIHPTRALFVDPDAIQQRPNGAHEWDQLRLALMPVLVQRLRSTTGEFAASMERMLAAEREANRFGQFLIFLVGLFATAMLASYMLASGQLAWTEVFAWQYLLAMLVPAVGLLAFSRIPLADVGLTLKGWRKATVEGFAFSIAAVAGAFLLGFLLRRWGVIDFEVGAFNLWVEGAYVVHSFGQEFIARGLMQGSLHRFLGPRSGWLSVILTSLLFACVHIQFGLVAVGVLLAAGVIFGAIYLRHRSLISVTMVHASAGIAAYQAGLLP